MRGHVYAASCPRERMKPWKLYQILPLLTEVGPLMAVVNQPLKASDQLMRQYYVNGCVVQSEIARKNNIYGLRCLRTIVVRLTRWV